MFCFDFISLERCQFFLPTNTSTARVVYSLCLSSLYIIILLPLKHHKKNIENISVIINAYTIIQKIHVLFGFFMFLSYLCNQHCIHFSINLFEIALLLFFNWFSKSQKLFYITITQYYTMEKNINFSFKFKEADRNWLMTWKICRIIRKIKNVYEKFKQKKYHHWLCWVVCWLNRQ
jgi:hypothetical protein